MHEAGEKHLRNEIKHLIEKTTPDTHHITVNSNAACVLKKAKVLEELKHKRDKADTKKAKQVKWVKKSKNVTPVIPGPTLV